MIGRDIVSSILAYQVQSQHFADDINWSVHYDNH